MLLGWRMVRPGLLPLWAGAPLGAFDDLVSGQPFGSAILLWSLAMIAIELIETRFPWRGFWQDWFTAGTDRGRSTGSPRCMVSGATADARNAGRRASAGLAVGAALSDHRAHGCQS